MIFQPFWTLLWMPSVPRQHLRALIHPCGRDVVVVDAPGQWDTRGDEIDIATSAACRQIAQGCKTLASVEPKLSTCFVPKLWSTGIVAASKIGCERVIPWYLRLKLRDGSVGRLTTKSLDISTTSFLTSCLQDASLCGARELCHFARRSGTWIPADRHSGAQCSAGFWKQDGKQDWCTVETIAFSLSS